MWIIEPYKLLYISKAKRAKKRTFAELSEKLDQLDKKHKNLKEIKENEQVNREQSEERTKMLQEIQKLNETQSKLVVEIKKYQDSDPDAIELLIAETKVYVWFICSKINNLFNVKVYAL